MINRAQMEETLFAKWGNRCPIDGALLFLEQDPECIPMIRCGRFHYMTVEHYVAAMCQAPLTDACNKLKELFGDDYIPHWNPLHAWFKSLDLTPLQPFDFKAGESEYWAGRGFNKEDQVKYGFGLINDLPGITYKEEEGTIFGWIQGLPDIPENTKVVELGKKYKYVDKNSKRRLWGVPQAKILMESLRVTWVVVTEGCLDAARFMQAGIPAVALNQPSFTRSHLIELSKLSLDPIICPDNDEAGKAIKTNGEAAAFLPVFFNATLWISKKKDPACYNPEELLAEFKTQFPQAGV